MWLKDGEMPLEMGVMLKDHSHRLYPEIKEALRERKILFLRKIHNRESREEVRLRRRKERQ